MRKLHVHARAREKVIPFFACGVTLQNVSCLNTKQSVLTAYLI